MKDKPLSYKEVNQQHYLKASLKEIHRIKPLVAIQVRKLREDVLHVFYFISIQFISNTKQILKKLSKFPSTKILIKQHILSKL